MEKLSTANIEDIIGLSPMQEGMLFYYINNPDNLLYYSQIIIRLSGFIDSAIFIKAWNIVSETNEMLRTVFKWKKLKKPIQIILKEYSLPIMKYDFSFMHENECRKHADDIIKKDRENYIDISSQSVRITLLKLCPTKYEMVITYYHIVSDGWSNAIIIKEFIETYNALFNGKLVEKITKTKYKEFIKWHQLQNKSEQKNFWMNYLSGFKRKTRLPRDSGFQGVINTEYYTCELNQAENDMIYNFIKEKDITLSSVFFMAWGVLLQKYSESDDVVFGTTVSGRTDAIHGIENMVGLFINTLPLRFQCNTDMTVIHVLNNMKSGLHQRSEFEGTPLVEIKSYSEIDRGENLFDSIIVFENYPIESCLKEQNNVLNVNGYSVVDKTNFDITLGIITFDGIKIILEYNSAVFSSTTIERLCKHYLNIVSEIVLNPEKRMSQISMLTSTEIENNIALYNNIQNSLMDVEIDFDC